MSKRIWKEVSLYLISVAPMRNGGKQNNEVRKISNVMSRIWTPISNGFRVKVFGNGIEEAHCRDIYPGYQRSGNMVIRIEGSTAIRRAIVV